MNKESFSDTKSKINIELDLGNMNIQNLVLSLDENNDKIKVRYMQEDDNMDKKYLEMHPYAIYKGADNYYHTYLPMNEGGREPKKRASKKDLEKLIIQFWKEQSDKHYFNDVLMQWLDYKLEYGELYKQSYDRYVLDYKRFFVGTDFGKMEIKDINEDILDEFIRRTIKTKQLTSKAYSGFRILVKGCFKFAVRKGYTALDIEYFFHNLDLSPKIFASKNNKIILFSNEEENKIEEWIEEHNSTILNLAILLGFYTGLRAGELVALSHSDFDLEKRMLHVSKTEIKYRDAEGKYVYEVRNSPKTDAGERDVILCDKAIEIYQRICKLNPSGDFLVVSGKGNRMRGVELTKKLFWICDKLQIEHKSMHKVRKTYATKLIDAGLNESLIIAQMGHNNITTTKNHYYGNNMELSGAQKKIEMAVSY